MDLNGFVQSSVVLSGGSSSIGYWFGSALPRPTCTQQHNSRHRHMVISANQRGSFTIKNHGSGSGLDVRVLISIVLWIR
jgi:hypothetical protein